MESEIQLELQPDGVHASLLQIVSCPPSVVAPSASNKKSIGASATSASNSATVGSSDDTLAAPHQVELRILQTSSGPAHRHQASEYRSLALLPVQSPGMLILCAALRKMRTRELHDFSDGAYGKAPRGPSMQGIAGDGSTHQSAVQGVSLADWAPTGQGVAAIGSWFYTVGRAAAGHWLTTATRTWRKTVTRSYSDYP